eukprot:CAMPEP_0204333726 /NCGR_PEP_ID=MMETSP0469-20131031/17451_1 /ASSEMBLY_ACC=CAM_ASM_000384 /TAXON_ID=2969 /ORGANISM="Oxyrrhis marina" /LENGTH=42 /DNA_ID= /DNA_START= /DNA_END= /DNA_ORIENTATION=
MGQLPGCHVPQEGPLGQRALQVAETPGRGPLHPALLPDAHPE